MMKKIILASRSPRRVELLKQIHIDSFVVPADIDESVLPGELPADYVLRLAEQKAAAVMKQLHQEYLGLPVLAADTTVTIDTHILGKPEDDADAMRMLKLLSGTTHQVYTGVAVMMHGEMRSLLSATQVEIATLSDELLDAYIASGQHRDKAGAYAIQGLAATWIKRINGSYSGVMGLPLYETAQLLGDYLRHE